jgi:uncharacterized membrane protein SpoIIM required for sporulation
VQQGGAADADEMAKDFVQLVDDLSYSKTFYPTSKVTQFINALASRIYLRIYQNRKEESNRLVKFWKYDVPMTIAKHYRVILFGFFLFLLFYAVGFFTSKQDPSFMREVLSDNYVDTTEKNIEEGNPFGIYQSGNSFFMWLGIMINNVMYSIITFVKGIALGVLSVSALVRTAMEVGSFHYMFFAKGYGFDFVLAVMLHGLLELTAIVITCGAGIVMGTSYLFPGTIRRLDAFRNGVKDGVKIVIGLIPVFAIAAFFEGFVTRHYKMHISINILLLSLSAAFIVWYFIIWPFKLTRRARASEPLPLAHA